MSTFSRILLFTALIFITLTPAVNSQNAVRAEVFAEIIPALTATQTAQLNFGRFSPTTQGGQVIITPEGVRMASGTVVLAEGPHQSARFYVTGEVNSSYCITFPTESSTLQNTLNSKTLKVSRFISSTAAGQRTGLLANGGQEVKVGATLTVGPPEINPVGIYSGTYVIRFDYN